MAAATVSTNLLPESSDFSAVSFPMVIAGASESSLTALIRLQRTTVQVGVLVPLNMTAAALAAFPTGGSSDSSRSSSPDLLPDSEGPRGSAGPRGSPGPGVNPNMSQEHQLGSPSIPAAASVAPGEGLPPRSSQAGPLSSQALQQQQQWGWDFLPPATAPGDQL